MENTSLLPLFRRWWRYLLLAAVLGGVGGYLLASRAAPTYEADVKLLVGPVNTEYETLRASGELSRTYADLATSRPALQFAIRRTGARTTPRDLIESGAVRTTSNDVTRIVAITVQYGDPRTAAAMANALGERVQQLARETPEQETAAIRNLMSQTEVEQLEPEEQAAVGEAVRRVLGRSLAGIAQVVDPAEAPADPVAPRVPLLTVIAALMALLAMGVIILLRESSAKDLADERSLAAMDGPAYLGTVTAPPAGKRGGGALVVEDGEPGVLEEYRALAAKLGFLDDRPRVRSLLLLDPSDSRRSAVAAVNLAAALAETGRRVLLLDADTAPGGATSSLDLEGRPGYADLVLRMRARGGQLNGEVDELRVARTDHFAVLPRGTVTGGVLDEERAQRLLERLQGDADVVIVVAGPISRSTTALVWAGVVDGTLVVVDENRTSEEDIDGVIRGLRFVDGTVVGTVIGRTKRGRLGGRGRARAGSA